MKLETLSFRDKFDILLEKRLSGIAELRYIMVYGKFQIMLDYADFNKKGNHVGDKTVATDWIRRLRGNDKSK